ncbi:MAG: alpha/beta hydrolase [Dehalococcoidia bacterium]
MPAEPVRFSADGLSLEGILDLPATGSAPYAAVVVCHPHPLYGGSMHDAVVAEVCRALLERGIATLRFNFRGTGASAGEHAGGVGERDDLWAALDYLRGRDSQDIDPARLGLAGYSFGAGVALNAGIAAGVKVLVAVSPPPRMIDFTAMQGYAIPVLLIAGDRDHVAPAGEVQRLVQAIGPRTTCTIVPGADHFWGGRSRELRDAVGAFIGAELLVSGRPPAHRPPVRPPAQPKGTRCAANTGGV